MITSPLTVIEKGWLTFPSWMTDKQKQDCIQQVGIDITLDRCFMVDSSVVAVLSENGRNFKPVAEMVPHTEDGFYNLHQGYNYDWSSDFTVNVPEDRCALIVVRSSLNRVGGGITSGIFDPSYVGSVAGALRLFAGSVNIERHARIAQIIFIKAESATQYNGIYNNLDTSKHWAEQVAGMGT